MSLSVASSVDIHDLIDLMASSLNAVAAPVYVKGPDQRWLFANTVCCQLLDTSPEKLEGCLDHEVAAVMDADLLRSQDTHFFTTETASDQPIVIKTHRGQRHFLGERSLLHTNSGPVLVNTLKDISELVQVRTVNKQIQQQLEECNSALDQLTEFEATLKRITDRVRDSLDEKQILQTAVQEITEALNVRGSNTSLYDLEQGTSTIYYEYTTLPSDRGRVSQMESFPEVYHQLLEGQYFQFCSIAPNPVRGLVSMLACSIFDDRGVLGDLWLINNKEHGFSEYEIRLVQQVANQCAIAIRQARLYQESQSQVRELEQVNTLKDDFLSTVSHELRTPVTSMRVALQLLGVTLTQELGLEHELAKPDAEQGRIARYYRILKEECEREISLINDLLDLQRLDVGNHELALQTIQMHEWLPALVSSFQERATSRQQQLKVAIAETVEHFQSDLSSLDRIWAELLNNACKYTPPGGEITLSVAQVNDDTLRFTLVNTGVEIPQDELPRIFDKFYRIPSADPWKQGGTGLGLALVQKLVHHINGVIAVTSGNNQTCFTIELPLSFTP
ncbi:multi-sensor signal transduction histidine kinase [Leptolyngbya sp. Heron Island J]|uniref:GAF domain-containing sensor histidine kinase n=1 Tax=Leptolyngbya sp. Heron Island J TaxID=1385935 RepID=UPI0003B9F607|nr:ATP-binding protein [Leptolyngbya sp. Heron Island J]ESA35378.1 multi-sensor signal transduction histidine kinase [Leptolyngbya sp. Heron Island J]